MAADRAGFDLIVGLGNPGPSYEQTRHNVGFWWVDDLASRYGCALRTEAKYNGDVCRATIEGHDCRLLKPMTFMNRSGQPLSALANFFKIPAERILVAHDDLDLPPGTIRLKKGGGHGGHNGLRDIISCFGKDFYRLRIGIGHPGHRDQVTDFVLGRPAAADREAIVGTLDDATRSLPDMLDGNLDRVMQQLHTLK
ncbi:aminoacyl-tRNA hydrolase [Solemya pervernicosa gill symbiont]|uniref:Peptidyl-tRNA hydrolase n=2 Tax=Gammaproteobacteria incertae sedis TaxID=118884 RepID=A0A1T2L0J8_9GAMM|nr:aminoacyl-tRNA hydrolase [Candidatus Reidiella endopervernicosa]OOZ38625.1 aminoacyl-tRNA hydrolase [Solemya pervernicosa gill symbiont]QKQ26001.1 aminoacyl-tRNA hydrolase [Candidatus Reidiella endopervernicosa]